MPVRRTDPENHTVNPYRRLSASQVIAWKNCPRLWYYGWISKLKSPLPPPVLRGNAVEECVCRVLRDSPSLIAADSKASLRSPLADDGSPDLDNPDYWVGPGLNTVAESLRPTDRESLHMWATSRADVHFQGCWDRAIEDWEASPNRVGSSSDIDPDEGREMVESAIRLHLDQVEACIKAGGGPGFEQWRSGERENWPAPDGFPRSWESPHPSVGTGTISWSEAWEFARPWFVDPDAKSFTQTSAHPGEWFQGEYDLVYRWSGTPLIVDLKASIGKGDRSGGYLDQLRMYGWLWWETHSREEIPLSLEIWYLGTGSIKEVNIPSEEEMLEMGSELEQLYQAIHARDPEISECPTNPSPLRYFDAGGIPSNPPTHPSERARCTYCDYRGFCEGSDHEIRLPLENRIERFGHAWPVTPIAEVVTRTNVVGEVVGLQGPELQGDGGISLEFTLQDGYDRARIRPSRQGFPRDVTRSISEGSRVKVENGVPSMWRGQLQIDIDGKSSVSIADEGDEAPVVEVETRVSVVGRVWSVDAFPNGVDVTRWSITIMDQTGSAASVAFKQFIPVSAASITRGDDIAILNGEVGEWAGRPQVRIGPGTRVVILRHADDTLGF
tara:strand:- start:14264 stop:16099 length:1836 start_codon:yes stop_codon:yes gene_type:complete